MILVCDLDSHGVVGSHFESRIFFSAAIADDEFPYNTSKESLLATILICELIDWFWTRDLIVGFCGENLDDAPE